MDGRSHRLMRIDPVAGDGSCRLCGDVFIVSVPSGPNGERSWVCPSNSLVKKYKESLTKKVSRQVRGSRPSSQRASVLWTKYGLTPEDYALLLSLQDGLCSICKRPIADGRDLHVDHCHDTNRVRGLLCFSCNAGLGSFKDNPVLLQRAIEYLELYSVVGALV